MKLFTCLVMQIYRGKRDCIQYKWGWWHEKGSYTHIQILCRPSNCVVPLIQISVTGERVSAHCGGTYRRYPPTMYSLSFCHSSSSFQVIRQGGEDRTRSSEFTNAEADLEPSGLFRYRIEYESASDMYLSEFGIWKRVYCYRKGVPLSCGEW